jgi:hemerythrin superfamily protein
VGTIGPPWSQTVPASPRQEGYFRGRPDGAEREALFEEMKTKLLAHAHAEQEVLYRPLEASQSESSRSLALEGVNEHQILEKQLQKLSAEGDKSSEQWS